MLDFCSRFFSRRNELIEDHVPMDSFAEKQVKAISLFQNYLTFQYYQQSQVKKQSFPDLAELESVLGIDQLWPWQKLKLWLSSYLWRWVGGKEFSHLHQLSKKMRTRGYSTLITHLMLKKKFITHAYNYHFLLANQLLYGEEDFSDSLLTYYFFIKNNADAARVEEVEEVEEVLKLFNTTPYVKIIIDSDKLTLTRTDVEDPCPLIIQQNAVLIHVLKEMAHKKEIQAQVHFDQIKQTVKSSLQNPWTLLMGESFLRYNGLSFRQILMSIFKRNHFNNAVYALIIFLRTRGYRQDALRLYLNLLQLNEKPHSSDNLNEFLTQVKLIFTRVIQSSNEASINHSVSTGHSYNIDLNIAPPLRSKAINTCIHDPLMRIVNNLFEQYGYHEKIRKQTLDDEVTYEFCPMKVTYNTKKNRWGRRFWIPIADTISLFNALGSAFFAGFAFFLTGQLTWGIIILTAAFFTNVLLFITAQRETLIQLLVKRKLLHGVSFNKKVVIAMALVLCLAASLFEGYMISISAATALAHISILPGFLLIGISALVGIVMAIGMFALFFYTSIQLIKSDAHLAVAKFIYEHLLFKGFWAKSAGGKCLYLLNWILNLILLPLALIAGFIYTAAYLGLGYHEILKNLQVIPHLTQRTVAISVAVFVGIAMVMEVFFSEVNFLRLANLVVRLPSKIIQGLGYLKQRYFKSDYVVMEDETEISSSYHGLQTLFLQEEEKTALIPHLNQRSLTEDTIWNTPERYFLPFARAALYLLVIGFLIPINGFGNAKSTTEGTPVLLDLLQDAGLHHASEWVANQVVFFTGFIGSAGICSLFAYDTLSQHVPPAKPQRASLVKPLHALPYNPEHTFNLFYEKHDQQDSIASTSPRVKTI